MSRAPSAGDLLQSTAHLVALALLLRAGTLLSLLLHEWSHLVAATLSRPGREHLTRANATGNLPVSAWLACLAGLRPLPGAPWVHIPSLQPPAEQRVRAAGPLCSALLALLATWTAPLLGSSVAGALCVATWAVAAAGFESDFRKWQLPGMLFCGNFGCILRLSDERTANLDDGPRILERMCAITQVRGGQAAGIASLVAAPLQHTPIASLARSRSYRLSGSVAAAAAAAGNGGVSSHRRSEALLEEPLSLEEQGQRAGQVSSVALGAPPPAMLASTRRRLVNTKRGDMPKALRRLYTAAAGKGYPAGAGSAAFIGHTRFATASLPAVNETHPHEWTPFGQASVWQFVDGQFQQSRRTVGIHLTHNGDLDAVRLFSHTVEVGELGLWLERVLHQANDTRGDSPKGAGMMELLNCQGRWSSAVRWAYQDCVAASLLDASGGKHLSKGAPSTAPGPAWWDAWAALLDECTAAHQAKLVVALESGGHRFVAAPVMSFVDEVVDHIRRSIPTAAQAAALGLHPDNLSGQACTAATLEQLQGVARQLGVRLIVPLQLRKFLKRAVEAWLYNDVTEALRQLLARATGSFGVTVLSALEPDTVAIAAQGQQMSLALHNRASIALYGSEAAAMKVPVSTAGDGSKAFAGFMTHRLDLDETHGEVIRLSLRPRPAIRNTADADSLLDVDAGANLDSSFHGADENSHRPSAPAPDAAPAAGQAAWGGFMWAGFFLNTYRVKLRREETGVELRARLVPLLGNPLVQPLPLLSGAALNDPVGADIEAIPGVLARVRDEWREPESLNRLTATAFARMLLEKMAVNQEGAASAHEARNVDVLVVGCETSLWMGEQFAADLQRALPKVHCVAMSANKLVQMYGTTQPDVSCTGFVGVARSMFPIRNAIVLVISQSGQTFPVLHSTRLLRHALGDRVFVLTGEYDTKMGLAFQNMAQPQPFCCRIFSNFSGWRPSEPTTVAACAAYATLTELLVFMLHSYSVELGQEQAQELLGMAFVRDDVRCLAELRDASITQNIPQICLRADGKSVVGLGLREASMQLLSDWTSGTLPGAHENLVAAGQEWAARVTEGWHATVFSACYVAGTILFQWAPFNVVSVLVGAGAPFYFQCQTSAAKCAIGFALRFVDVVVYIWIGWVFLLLRRRLHRRPVFARRGKRVLVIADVPWVHQSIEIYVSKLFALSYGDNGLDVHGANPVDSFVHRFTHRVQRGVLIALGRPDGRVASLSRVENAGLLAAMQAAAIQNMGTGPEIFSVGHNTFHGNPSAIARHVVLPTHRRPFVCEFLAKTVLGTSDGHGRMDPTTILAQLGAGVIVLPEAMALAGAANNMCDRCGTRAAKKLCTQCGGISLCAVCNMLVHAQGGPESQGHGPLPLSAALRMRLKARQARLRVLGRHEEKTQEGRGRREASKRGYELRALGADVGNAFPDFGVQAAAVMLKGHGKLAAAQGMPLGMHHARVLLAHVAADRARQRWRTAISAVCAMRNPWKRLLMDLAATEESLGKFANVLEEVDVASHAVLDAEVPMKDMYEGRFASLERYIAFLVMFHAMALRVANTSWPLPPWDISRSQSILRVASTAAPVSGAEVAEQLAGNAAPTAFVVRRKRVLHSASADHLAPASPGEHAPLLAAV